MLVNYGYNKIIINKLEEINRNENNHYNYKKLNFLVKSKNENENIIIMFHGALSSDRIDKYEYIFRGYNYNILNSDIICISDFLLDKYKNFCVNWGLETEKYKTDEIYLELFNYLINSKNYKNVVFTGTSAGGFPALKFASYLNKICLISNSQLYLENYKRPYELYYTRMLINDKVIYNDKMIEKIILKNKPQKIIYYQNINDNGISHDAYNDFLQFKEFINNNNLNDICDLKPFVYPNPDNLSEHSLQFPPDNNYQKILSNCINNL